MQLKVAIAYLVGRGVNAEMKICRLIGMPCVHLRRLGEPCSDAPTLEDARQCILKLGEENDELRGELNAVDEWVDALRVQLRDSPEK